MKTHLAILMLFLGACAASSPAPTGPHLVVSGTNPFTVGKSDQRLQVSAVAFGPGFIRFSLGSSVLPTGVDFVYTEGQAYLHCAGTCGQAKPGAYKIAITADNGAQHASKSFLLGVIHGTK